MGHWTSSTVINNYKTVHNLSGDYFQTQDKPQCAPMAPKSRSHKVGSGVTQSSIWGHFPRCAIRNWGLSRAWLLQLRRQNSELGAAGVALICRFRCWEGDLHGAVLRSPRGSLVGSGLAMLFAHTVTLMGLWEGGWHPG